MSIPFDKWASLNVHDLNDTNEAATTTSTETRRDLPLFTLQEKTRQAAYTDVCARVLPGAVCRCIRACEEAAWPTGPVDSAAPRFCPSQNIPVSVPL